MEWFPESNSLFSFSLGAFPFFFFLYSSFFSLKAFKVLGEACVDTRQKYQAQGPWFCGPFSEIWTIASLGSIGEWGYQNFNDWDCYKLCGLPATGPHQIKQLINYRDHLPLKALIHDPHYVTP